MFVVVETQRNADNTVSVLTSSYASENEAYSNYHRVLTYAAVSDIPVHSAFLLVDDGNLLKSECFKHEAESEATE